MILHMLIEDAEGKVLSDVTQSVTSNQLNRIHAPLLHGKAMYHLKKHKKVEINLADGVKITYSINPEHLKKKFDPAHTAVDETQVHINVPAKVAGFK